MCAASVAARLQRRQCMLARIRLMRRTQCESDSPFSDADQQGVLDVILPIQQREFGIPITAADQPDLTEHSRVLSVGDRRLLGGSIQRRSRRHGSALNGISALCRRHCRKMFCCRSVSRPEVCAWRGLDRCRLYDGFGAGAPSDHTRCDDGVVPLICPTLLKWFRNACRSTPAVVGYFAWGCFRCLFVVRSRKPQTEPALIMLWLEHSPQLSTFSAAMNASCGMSTLPNCRIFFLPSFCFSRSLRLRVMSPP